MARTGDGAEREAAFGAQFTPRSALTPRGKLEAVGECRGVNDPTIRRAEPHHSQICLANSTSSRDGPVMASSPEGNQMSC